jgi:transposase
MPKTLYDTEVAMSHWATAPIDRLQVTLFAPTLDDSLTPDHPVRLFDEIVNDVDFSDWESMYVRVAGQPPIHPRLLAKVILYGLSLGIRSSRKLEDACRNRLDFIWLVEGRVPDHSTFCDFRTQFGPQLKVLFRKIGRVGIEMGLVTLNQVVLDGADTRANNSRHNTARRTSLEQKTAALDAQIELLMKQAEEQDKSDDNLYGRETSPTHLPRELKDLKRRQEKLKEAMKKLAERESARAGRKDVSSKGPAIPLADPDSRVLPNKVGGHAPNYTSVLATDADSGMILDTQVLAGNDETSTVLPAVENIERELGAKPKQMVADSGFNSGPNLAGLEEKGIEPLMPARQEFRENPAIRPDPAQPVPAEQRARLPINPQNKILDKAAFIHDAANDCYRCPMGKTLDYSHDKAYKRDEKKGTYRIYQCAGCAGCPLAPQCLPKNATERNIGRDEYEGHRQRTAERMKSEKGRAQYKRRSHAAETPFADLKSKMNFRQFLLRGLNKVAMELRWAATAYNVLKLMKFKAAQAAKTLAAMATLPVAAMT